ncbi:hypothetical protein HN587_00855 [Candidatus Woesearchaeota archaeon]|jgi:phosphate uptake regulator|nr:hypothetical protein [Candidatus Woesearchaeota archaeon]
MNRKLIKQGGTGLTLYVPKKWVNRLELNPGDEVAVSEDGNNLIIAPQSVLKEKKIELDATDLDDNSLRIALSLIYWQGYNLIEIINKNKFSFVGINKLIDKFTGLVIIDQKNDKIIIKNSIKEEPKDFDKILNKLFITVKYMFSLILEGFNNSFEKNQEISELRQSILKQSNYCQKLIFINNFGKEKTYEYVVLVLMLKKISGSLFYLSQIKEFNLSLEKYFINLFNIFGQLHESFFKQDYKFALRIYEQLNKAKDQIYLKTKMPIAMGTLVEHLFSLSLRIVSVFI